MNKLGDLSNDELLARLRAHLGRGHVWLAGLLAYLAEVDARRLYAEHACPSMWDFCVRRLGMSEGEAQRRIAAARVVRRFPVARGYLERGEIHLCAVYEMHKHLTEDNHEELLREAVGKSTKAVAEMIAARFPRPDVFSCIEPLAPQPALRMAPSEVNGPSVEPRPTSTASENAAPQVRPRVEPLSATRYRVELAVSAGTKAKLERVRDLLRHRNPTGDLEKIFDLALDLLLAALEKERLGKTSRSKAKPRSEAPTVDGATSLQLGGATSAQLVDTACVQRVGATSVQLVDAASARLVKATEAQLVGATHVQRIGLLAGPDAWDGAEISDAQPKEESAATARGRQTPAPREKPTNEPAATSLAESKGSKKRERRRHIARAVRREVWARDGEQCTYVDADGNRCPARGFLELDHVEPQALGGSDEATNLRLRCRVHNHLHAEQVFGREYVEQRMHLRRRKYAEAHAPSFDAVAGGLRSLGFREPEVRAAMGQLRAKLDPATPPETILRAALEILTERSRVMTAPGWPAGRSGARL